MGKPSAVRVRSGRTHICGEHIGQKRREPTTWTDWISSKTEVFPTVTPPGSLPPDAFAGDVPCLGFGFCCCGMGSFGSFLPPRDLLSTDLRRPLSLTSAEVPLVSQPDVVAIAVSAFALRTALHAIS